MDKEYTLRAASIAVALLAAYLWSGGLWEYHSNDRVLFKSNKITGTTYVLYESEWKRIEHGGDLK